LGNARHPCYRAIRPAAEGIAPVGGPQGDRVPRLVPSRAWYRENRILFWICVMIGVNQLGFGSIVPAVPLYAHSFGVPQSAIGLTIAIYGLARFLLNVPSGRLADSHGRRATLALGGLVSVAGNVLCALAPSYLPFLLARFVAGAGAALVLTGGQIVLADISTPERRGRMMATYQGVFVFAVGAGPIPGGLLAEHFGLAAPFWAYAALAIGTALVSWFLVPETRGMQGGVRVAQAAGAAPKPSFLKQLGILTANRGFLLVSLVSFGAFFARTGGLFNLIPVLGKERLDLSADQIGLGLGIISLLGLVLAYPSGMLADRFGRKAVIVPATLLTGGSFLLFLVAPSYAWFLGACLAWALATAISGAAPAAYAADNAPAGMNAAAMSSYRMLSDLGYVVGPLVLGAAADLFGVNAALAGIALLMTTIALLFARFAPESHRRARPASA
jgi:MFS transporter, DHA1 family, multidrug resistance protein